MAVPQKLHATGHREPPSTHVEEQKTKSFPHEDANTNKTFFGPAGLAKGAGSGRHKTALNVNAPSPSLSVTQKARRRK